MRCECGEPIEPGQKFCIVCGRKIIDAVVSDEDASLVQNTVDQDDAAPDDSSGLSDGSAAVSDGDTAVSDDFSPVTDESSDETDGSLVPSHESGKKRTRHKVIIAVIVVLALVLAGFGGFALWGMKNGAAKTSASDKDTVHYSDSKASKVHKRTVIVLYGKDGKPLEQYKVNVMDDSGAVSSHSVTDGQFTPDEVGMKPGKQYTVVAKDPSGNVYSLPKTDVRPDSEASDAVHGDKLNVKPSDSQQDSKTEESSACSRQKMYLAYYDVISSLQKKYGEGEVATDSGYDAGYLHGLSVVLLADSDGDGEDDELITVHDNDNDKTGADVLDDWRSSPEGWTVQAWSYNTETGKASDWYKENPVHSNGGWFFFEQAADENGRVTLPDSEILGYDSNLEYTDYLLSPIGSQFSLGSLGNNHAIISGEDALSKTQETIYTIKQGMMADCNVSQAKANDSSKAADDMQIAVGGSYAKGYVLRDGVVWAIDDNEKALKLTGMPAISKLFIGGFNGNYALAKDGSLWAWGNPSSIFGLGSLGNGKPGEDDFSEKSGKPVKVHNLKNVATMYSGLGRSYAVLKDGTAWTWGDECSSSGCSESYGEEILEPKQIDGLKDIIDIAGWHGVNYALKSDGTVLRWVDERHSYDGDLPLKPTAISGLPKIKSISIGYAGFCLLDEQGNVWDTYSYSSSSAEPLVEPRKMKNLPAIKSIKQVDANEDVGGVAYFIGTNGELWAYGSNGATCGAGNNAALGDGTCTTPDDPVRVKGVSKVRDVTVAWGSSWALTDSGDLYQWGTCNGSGEQANIPKKIESGSVRKIYAAPSSYLMMVKKDGSIWGKSVSPSGGSDDFTQIRGIK
ncbi:hypothetical protein PL960_05580 [Bifidobacterium adolescentis]|nr:hypothetical protein [Bifidobacterium adolescentis]MDB1501751.1 hypothetical protein [Bifidobacterium adolescentis]